MLDYTETVDGLRDRAGVISKLNALEWRSAPIEPSWILAGQPTARSGFHSASQDKAASTNVWDCTAGTFRWYFGWDETILILEGEVKVTSPSGQTIVLKAGHIAHFAAETTWVWEVERYVRKLAFHRKPTSRSVRLLEALCSFVRRKVSGLLPGLAPRLHRGSESLLAILWCCTI